MDHPASLTEIQAHLSKPHIIQAMRQRESQSVGPPFGSVEDCSACIRDGCNMFVTAPRNWTLLPCALISYDSGCIGGKFDGQ
jgi:hypothetical protein